MTNTEREIWKFLLLSRRKTWRSFYPTIRRTSHLMRSTITFWETWKVHTTLTQPFFITSLQSESNWMSLFFFPRLPCFWSAWLDMLQVVKTRSDLLYIMNSTPDTCFRNLFWISLANHMNEVSPFLLLWFSAFIASQSPFSPINSISSLVVHPLAGFSLQKSAGSLPGRYPWARTVSLQSCMLRAPSQSSVHFPSLFST